MNKLKILKPMEITDRLSRMFSYDLWANEQILHSLQENPSFSEVDKAVSFYAHIAASQEMWHRRIKDQPINDLKIWPEYNLSLATEKLNMLAEQWQALIHENATDLDHLISYKNSKGTVYKTMLSDILYHLVIHGQHHRAQIASMLRNAEINPPATDFIFFSRI